MQQQSLFDIGGVSCKHCRCFLASISEMRERCPATNGTHEVSRSEYFVLAGKSYSTKPEFVTGAAKV